jgi:hypothetical protein
VKHATLSAICAALLATALAAAPARAQRAFVAAQGSDANPCTFALPCRTFQHAHDTVAAGGEIDVLDPAGYGMLTITKAISIQGHGFSGISVTGGNTGITINAAATDAVNLNGLLIEGSAAGANGIRFNSGRSLMVENCLLHGMTGTGLRFSSSATTPQTLSVADSHFSDNNATGILILTSSSGAVTATLDRVTLSGNGAAVNVIGNGGTGAINMSVTDSLASNSAGGTGFIVQSAAGDSVGNLVLTRTTVSGNAIGVAATGTNATIRLAQSSIIHNAIGFSISGGSVLSYGDNIIDDNGGNAGALGSASKQ